ncbi:MAG TPA: protein kinase, partial [Candidatus Eisenbacteria bacterium]
MASARTLQPQDQIAHYRIVGPLGAGGMGEVYLAQDQTLERNVALKILPPELVQSEERVRRFVREAKSASSLNHPNIVTIYEIGQDEVHGADSGAEKDSGSSVLHYISMELVSGETLTTKIHHDKTDLRTLLGYLAQAAEGLAKAHAAGIVHRDLKPGNIMVSKDGFAKVLDFGLAKLTEKAPAEGDVTSGPTHVGDGTSVGAVVGTVGYMSPEQVRAATVDHRSDIFSFGCILYEAATRTKPFLADSNVETMHKILHDKPTPVEELNKEVPAEVRRLIRRCLAKNPDQRFQSAKDLAIELREIVDEYDTLSASGSSGSGSSAMGAPAPARKRISPAALIGGAVVVAGILVAAAMLFGRGKGEGDRNTSGTMRVSTVTNRGIASDAALSADGRYLAYTILMQGKKSIWVRQVATGSDVQVLPPQEDTPFGLTFTPDGSYLYYLGNDPERAGYKALFEVPTLGGTPRKRTYDVDSRVTFSPDGKQVCFRRGVPHKKQEALVVFDLASGKERNLATVADPALFGQPAWSPDGKRVAAIENRGGGGMRTSIVTFRVADGKREPIGKNTWAQAGDLTWLADGKGLLVSALDPSTLTFGQLWELEYPSGRVRRITSDANFYGSISASADGTAMAAVRNRQESNLWSAAPSGPRDVRQLTFGSDEDGAVGEFSAGQDSSIYCDMIRDGAVQIWAIRGSGAGATMVSSGHRFAGTPFYRPGSGIVYIQANEDLMPHIWRADPKGENARQLTTGDGETPLDVS